MFDPVRKPAHYAQGREYQPIDIIEDWDLGFHLGNAIKYISRAGRKDENATLQDINKAVFYLERYGDLLREAGVGRRAEDLPKIEPKKDDQEEKEFQAMGELGTRAFGVDDLVSEESDSLYDAILKDRNRAMFYW